MRYQRIVANGLVVTPDGTARGNLGIRDGRIAAISPDPLQGDETIDARGRVVLPGAVTTVVEMPLNALPPTTTAAAFQTRRRRHPV